ncbi:MAG: cysteine peptidase family C39 domain-containing protein [Armatimonadota bacterium]|nr:cysteine peptidase family C39 domain-containing protein [Armatimonadota bacterium]
MKIDGKGAVAAMKYAMLLMSLMLMIPVGAAAQPQRADVMCGPKCLVAVCEYYGIDAQVKGIAKLAGADPRNGTNLLGLLHAGESRGLEGKAMKMSLDELISINLPAIAHLWNNHFVVVEPRSGSNFRAYDPSESNRTIDKQELRSLYSGFALLLSKDRKYLPESTPSGPDIRLDKYVYDFEFADPGTILSFTINCRNAGKTDLVINKISASVGTIVAASTHDSIAPGCSALVQVAFDLSNLRSTQQQSLLIYSNDPVTPIVHLRIVGCVRPLSVAHYPPYIDFGRVENSKTSTRVMVIPDSSRESVNYSDTPLILKLIASNSKWVSAKLVKSVGEHAYRITLSLKPGAPIGPLDSSVVVESNHPAQPRLQVPVRALITGDLATSTPSVFFGAVTKGQRVERSFSLSSMAKKPIVVRSVNVTSEYAKAVVDDLSDKDEPRVRVTLSENCPLGYLFGEIVLATDRKNEPVLRVPWYANVVQ